MNYYSPDDPALSLTHRWYLKYGNKLEYIPLALMGLLAWSLLYGLVFYLKDHIITNLRREEKFMRGYHYKQVNDQLYYKTTTGFAVIVIIIWVVILCIPKKEFVIKSGLFLFLTLYLIYLVKYYFYDDNDFDLIDDYKWLFCYLIVRTYSAFKEESEVRENEDEKVKTE